MSHPHIAVIVPSALRKVPGKEGYWLERAIGSVLQQTYRPKEIIVGLDPNVEFPTEIYASPLLKVRLLPVNGKIKGHQAACNAAVLKANAPLIAFLEDDDLWEPNHLATLVSVMDQTGADFVSTSQVEVDVNGQSLGRIFDYPTASGWLIKKVTWLKLGGFDMRYRIHHDNALIGAMNAAKVPRVHVIEETADFATRPNLRLVGRHSKLARIEGLKTPTVKRTIHETSIMGGMDKNPERLLRSAKEYAACEVLYGSVEATW